ncbi:MAG: glycosyltransferase, partial [Sulfolobales archaeon]|nr:glycosyltransferase [Sulfolobales archaeon]
MKYGVVAHHYWDRAGGGQLVCAAAARAFDSAGYRPVLASVPAFRNRGRYVEWFGIDLSEYEVVTLVNLKLRAFGIYLRLFVWVPMERAIEKYSPEVVFTDECTYRPVEDSLKKVRFVEYIHFPFEVAVDRRFRGLGLYYGEDQYVAERYGRFPMNAYWWLFTKLLPKFIRSNPFEVASAVLANSRWTAELAKQVYGERPEVLNPPLPPNVEVVSEPKPFEGRTNSVVMLGRFSEEKRYHWVVKEVLPKLRREVGDVKLYVVGSAGTRTSYLYVSKVETLARKTGFRVSRTLSEESDVYLITDAPRETIKNVMDSSKAFLHATVNEHWGIAAAEAMARGLPVVVHRSGGTWSDLVNEGR